jgi:isoquinoline 1-oxidoreductase beta subunit
MKNIKQLDRRSFLKVSALAGGGIVIGLYTEPEIFSQQRGAPPAPTPVNPSTYITVNPDNTFTIIAKNPETGQGIRTALPMVIADEFDVEWKQVKIQQGDLDPKYGRDMGAPTVGQIEGGSTATPQNYQPHRNVGAAARMMMVAAAAKQWNVPATELTTTGSGAVRHAASNRTATYASLAEVAMKMPPMAITDIKVKDQKDFKIMGTRVPGVDNLAIVTGKPSFSIDVNPPGMLYAVFEKCPVFGGKVVSANLDDVKKQPGIRHAFIVEPPPAPAAGAPQGGPGGGGPRWASGVAIVADNWWQAQNARTKVLKVVWDEGPVASQSSAGYMAQIKGMAAKASEAPAAGGPRAAKEGDAEAAFKTAAKIVEAEYEFPLLSHAPLEPQNSTAWYKDGKLEIWSPSQIPGLANAAVPAGVQNTDVTFHLVRAGGGFGRRLVSEYDIEVSKIARMVADERTKAGQASVPVKLLWSREDDMHFDNYRPPAITTSKPVSMRPESSSHFVISSAATAPPRLFPRMNSRAGSRRTSGCRKDKPLRSTSRPARSVLRAQTAFPS